MTWIRNCTVSEPEEDCGGDTPSHGGGKQVVLVGVRLDSQSKELLTWALVKVARSGDRVIALHVLNPNTGGKSTLISLVKTFDSVLAAYEGFCNLKQVDLKLKVCRGSSVRRVIVREAKSYGAANVILGTSKVHHTIWSSVSVAKYCATNLPTTFSVIAVNNGKILFQRGADSQDQSMLYFLSIRQSLREGESVQDRVRADGVSSKSNKGCLLSSQKFNSTVESSNGVNMENSLAMVPVKNQLLPGTKRGCQLLRRVFLHNQQQSDKYSLKNSVMHWVLRLPSQQSLAAEYPDDKRRNSNRNEHHSLNLDGECISIVPLMTDLALSPSSLGYCLKSLSEEVKGIPEKYSIVCRMFSYQELLLATSNFQPENMVGTGGSSQVYRGCLPDGKELAVKILKPSEDAFRQFVLEIGIITTLHHKNIISLLGFCFEDNNLLLVYNYLSRGSLEDNLHGNTKDEIAFGWEQRYKVALGVAEALDYLHNGAAEPVIHRDVKPSNILLSDNFEPQLSDFGLAMKALDSSHHMICADVAGTFGYLAPEYFMHGKVNDRIDVYAFGVVLLELLSGRKAIDSGNPKGQESLVMLAKSIMKDGKVLQLLDPSLIGKYNDDRSEWLVLAAALCIRRAPITRPQISLVLKLLQGDIEAIDWARQQVIASEELDAIDGEEFPTNMQSHLNMALLDLEDDSFSVISTDQTVSVEHYLQGRWSRSSSFE